MAGDALAIINYLNAFGAGPVPANAALGQPFGFLDTSGGANGAGDNFVTAGDALDVINFLNAGLGGEGESGNSVETETENESDLLTLLALDIALQPKRRR